MNEIAASSSSGGVGMAGMMLPGRTTTPSKDDNYTDGVFQVERDREADEIEQCYRLEESIISCLSSMHLLLVLDNIDTLLLENADRSQAIHWPPVRAIAPDQSVHHGKQLSQHPGHRFGRGGDVCHFGSTQPPQRLTPLRQAGPSSGHSSFQGHLHIITNP